MAMVGRSIQQEVHFFPSVLCLQCAFNVNQNVFLRCIFNGIFSQGTFQSNLFLNYIFQRIFSKVYFCKVYFFFVKRKSSESALSYTNFFSPGLKYGKGVQSESRDCLVFGPPVFQLVQLITRYQIIVLQICTVYLDYWIL